MSKALSVDLRVRVLAAVAAGATHREAADRFGVSAASVSRWRKREREQGDPRPKALGGDRRSDRIEAHHEAVMAALGPGRDATIEEVRGEPGQAGPRLRLRHDPALLRPPRHHAQKKTAHASEQDRPDVLKRREDWFEGQLDLDPERLVFIDETWASTNMARRHGRCRRGERLRVGVPHGHWKTTTFIGALTLAASSRPSCSTGRSTGRLRDLCRAGARPGTAPRRHRRHGQPVQPQGAARARADRGGGRTSCATCRPTAPTSTRSRTPSPSSRRSCAKPPSAPSSGLWSAIGRIIDLFPPAECANYFAAAGYDAD